MSLLPRLGMQPPRGRPLGFTLTEYDALRGLESPPVRLGPRFNIAARLARRRPENAGTTEWRIYKDGRPWATVPVGGKAAVAGGGGQERPRP